MDEPQIFGALFDSHTDTKPAAFRLDWPSFVSLFEAPHVRANKFGTELPTNTRQPLYTDAPGYSLAEFIEPRRKNENVIALSGLVLDFDKDFDIDDVLSRLSACRYLAHTSYSHTQAKPKWRVVVPTATQIMANDYKQARAWLVNSLGSNNHDAQAGALSNFYFLPACPPETTHLYELRVHDAPLLVLPVIRDALTGAWQNPPTRKLSAELDWPWLRARLRKHTDPELRAAFRQANAGEPFAAHGGRDTTLTRMAGVLAGLHPTTDPDVLATYFAPSLAAMAAEHPEDPPPDLANAADKIARAQSGLLAMQERAVEHARAQAQIPPDNAQPRSEEDLHSWSGTLAHFDGVLDEDDLMRRLFVRQGDSHYVFDPAAVTWRGAFVATEALQFARAALERVPGVQLYRRKADGSWGQRALPELLDAHGWIPSRIVADLRVDETTCDVAHDTFVLAGAPKRPGLEPRRHPVVEEWFAALGGKQHERFFDWLATFTRLDRPTSILFLRGAPNVGKSLLIRGLARLWAADSATDMARIAGNFNDELRRCPLVKIEEGPWTKHTDVTALLRDIVTQPSRVINRKHEHTYELLGYLRFILTANNFRIFANQSTTLTPHDREAIATRFLEVEPSKDATRIIEDLDPEDRDGLATRNQIAEHVLWLTENRAVHSPSRFLVAGDPHGSFALRIVTEDTRWGSWTVEWLARYLTNPTAIERTESHLISRTAGRVIINPEAVVNTFTAIVKNGVRPLSHEISNALRSLSTGELVPFPNGEREGFEILTDQVAAWSREKAIGSAAQITFHAANRPQPRAAKLASVQQ